MAETDQLKKDINELELRVAALEKQCMWFHMQVERMKHLYKMVQEHELRIFKLETENGKPDPTHKTP